MKDRIRIKGLAQAKIRTDGGALLLTFQTEQNKMLTLSVPAHEMQNLALQLLNLDRQALIRRDAPLDPDKKELSYEAPPYMFIAYAMSGIQREGGGLDLQIRDPHDKEIQIGLPPAFTKQLFELLLQSRELEDDEKAS